jgi:serine/threonine protein phosphatase 1
MGVDFVDKGTESPGGMRWVRHLSTLYHVVLIEGNHEEKHRRWRQHMRLGSPVVHTMTDTQQIAAITQAMSAADIDFLETARLYFRIPHYDALVVHAGVPPAITTLPEDPQEIVTYTRQQRALYGKMQRIRFVSPAGKILQLGHETERDRYWADLYDGRLGTVYFGHHVFLEPAPAAFPHAVGLDLGAVHGGYLAAAILSEQGVTYKVEPARRAYA